MKKRPSFNVKEINYRRRRGLLILSYLRPLSKETEYRGKRDLSRSKRGLLILSNLRRSVYCTRGLTWPDHVPVYKSMQSVHVSTYLSCSISSIYHVPHRNAPSPAFLLHAAGYPPPSATPRACAQCLIAQAKAQNQRLQTQCAVPQGYPPPHHHYGL